MNKEIAIIAHDMRSCHNVGSLLRTAEGMGVNRVYLTGYTPYPELLRDERLPHLRQKITNQIHKTALGSENNIDYVQSKRIEPIIKQLKEDGFIIAGLEQSASSIELHKFIAPNKIAILLGREVEGIDSRLLELCDVHLEIPMYGKKESLNVIQAAAMAMYQCRFVISG